MPHFHELYVDSITDDGHVRVRNLSNHDIPLGAVFTELHFSDVPEPLDEDVVPDRRLIADVTMELDAVEKCSSLDHIPMGYSAGVIFKCPAAQIVMLASELANKPKRRMHYLVSL